MAQSDIVPVAEPLYEQVYRIFRARIIGGQLKPQSLLPGEVMLSHELGVSVGTVRKAMDQLARDNLVIRERGRGTFVRGDDEWQDAKGLKLLDRAGRPIAAEIELVDAHLGTATAEEARSLRIEAATAGGPRVLRMMRHWRSGAVVVNREHIVVDAVRFARLAGLAGEGGPRLHKAYGDSVLERIERTVWMIGDCGSAAASGEDRATEPPAVSGSNRVLALGSLALDARGVPIETSRHEIQLDTCILQLNG